MRKKSTYIKFHVQNLASNKLHEENQFQDEKNQCNKFYDQELARNKFHEPNQVLQGEKIMYKFQ